MMNVYRLYIMLLLVCTTAFCFAQTDKRPDTNYVNDLLQQSKTLLTDDTAKSISLARQAIDISQRLQYPKGEGYALKNLGLVYYMQGRYVETLDYWNQSLKIFESIRDNVGIANLLNNIAAIYFDQGVEDRALDYSLRSLRIAERLDDKLRILSALTTLGAIYHNKKNPVAAKYLTQALELSEQTGNKDSYVVIAGNLGEIYYDRGEDAKAMEYYQKAINSDKTASTAAFAYNGIAKIYLRKGNIDNALKSNDRALAISEKLDEKMQIARAYRGKGDAYAAAGNEQMALEFYDKSIDISESLNTSFELKDLYKSVAGVYYRRGDYKRAYEYEAQYANIKDTLYNLETAKKLGKLQFDFDIAKKEGEINLLTKEKSLKEAEVRAARQARTYMIIGMIMIVAIAVIIYRNYLHKAKTNRILDKQKVEIETLLHNILPEEVADELKVQGFSKPRHFDEVSVLFTDFKGFTSIADKLSPTVLVEELNYCFMEFDNIIEKYDLEKIKTIGDAYMCAGNLPTPDPNHSYKIIKAGLDIQAFIDRMNVERREKGLEAWEIRIGIHIGPVVAGVVGKKKYAYDIWGSTVNIASRMESNGSPGRVNISSVAYQTVKEYFECSYRGKVYAKNLGDIDMYFVEYEKQPEPTEAAATLAQQ